jgi:hypothetical protein
MFTLTMEMCRVVISPWKRVVAMEMCTVTMEI